MYFSNLISLAFTQNKYSSKLIGEGHRNWRIHTNCMKNQEMVYTQYINASINISIETKHRADMLSSTGDPNNTCSGGFYKSINLLALKW